MKIASYLDYYDWSLDKQLNLFKLNELDQFILRHVNGKPFLSYLDKVNKYIFLLKKIKVGLFDPMLPPIDLDNEEIVVNLNKAVSFAKKIKTKNIVIQIKTFNEKEILTEELETYFKSITKITKRLNVLIRVDNENEMFLFNKIANEIKNRKIKLIYNPALIYQKGYSPDAAYRLFNKKMTLFELADTNSDKKAILVGYGVIDIRELFKNLYEDRFKGLITLNSNLDEVFKNFGINPNEVVRKEKKEARQKYLETIHKLGYIDLYSKKEVPFEDIIAHQIKLLKIVFK